MSVLLSSSPIESWRILQYDAPTALEQMAVDEQLANEAQSTLRLFRWNRPALSLGFKQPMPAWMDREMLASHGVEIVERPTAGGIAIHGSDLSISVVMPQQADVTLRVLMQMVCEALASAVRACDVECQWRCDVRTSHRIEYCLTEESPYAIMVGERKLCGLALRRYPASWLVQGSLLVRPLPMVLTRVMPHDVVEAFQARAISLEEARRRPMIEEELAESIMAVWRGLHVGAELASCGVAGS